MFPRNSEEMHAHLKHLEAMIVTYCHYDHQNSLDRRCFCVFFSTYKISVSNLKAGTAGTCRVCLLHLRAWISVAPAIPTVTLRPQVGPSEGSEGLCKDADMDKP